MSMINQSLHDNRGLLKRFFASVGIGMGIFLAAVTLYLVGHQLFNAGRIFRGVSVAGIDVGGLTVDQAAVSIREQLAYPVEGSIRVTFADQYWDASPNQLGFMVDPAASAQQAFILGRSAGLLGSLLEQFSIARYGRAASPVFIFNQQQAFQFVSSIAQQVDIEPVEASVTIDGINVRVNNGSIGHKVDIDATISALRDQLMRLQSGQVDLVVREAAPLVLDATSAAEKAQILLRSPFVLLVPEAHLDGTEAIAIEPPDMAKLLAFKPASEGESNGQIEVVLDDALLRAYLAGVAPDLDREPENPRFIFNDDSGLLELKEPAVIGRVLDIDQTAASVHENIAKDLYQGNLIFDITNPPVTDDMSGEQLGITELVHVETSYFRGSSADRVNNIQIAAARFLGLLVAPGETFSMADALGDVSLDNGYAEALIIVGDQTVKGVGGGVCQVSTTLFRAAFFAGFPIVERHAHAYRVGYYEQTASGRSAQLAGMDATVYVPIVDLKFTNDTPYWLLMETYVYPGSQSIVWKFYSTSDGRSVDWTTTGPVNIIEPPEVAYRENPELNLGEVVQVEWKAEGADVTVNRTVYKDGSVHFSDRFYTHFLPWGEVWEYGPGTDLEAVLAAEAGE